MLKKIAPLLLCPLDNNKGKNRNGLSIKPPFLRGAGFFSFSFFRNIAFHRWNVVAPARSNAGFIFNYKRICADRGKRFHRCIPFEMLAASTSIKLNEQKEQLKRSRLHIRLDFVKKKKEGIFFSFRSLLIQRSTVKCYSLCMTPKFLISKRIEPVLG